ncbi:MAG: hypothetical protein H0T66_08470 [Geodermatophilaceae bacterium]|nr:hypothetical protein [Geodermatophilaceae bacterium]MDQ3455663.1 hypothetical protein [Actinomycetota bacterium]
MSHFDSQIESEGFQGSPQLTVDRIVDAGETIVVPHVGETRRDDGSAFRFAACDILTFTGDLISRVESYVVPLRTE